MLRFLSYQLLRGLNNYDFIQEQDTPKFADVFFELFIALVPFFFISLISYLPIQLPLLGLCMFWFYRSTEKLQSVLITLSFIQSFFLNLLFFAILATWGNMYRVYGFSGRLSLPFLFGISSYIIATWPVCIFAPIMNTYSYAS